MPSALLIDTEPLPPSRLLSMPPREASLKLLHHIWNQAARESETLDRLRDAVRSRAGTPAQWLLPPPHYTYEIWRSALSRLADHHIHALLLTTCEAIADDDALIAAAERWRLFPDGPNVLEEACVVLLDALSPREPQGHDH